MSHGNINNVCLFLIRNKTSEAKTQNGWIFLECEEVTLIYMNSVKGKCLDTSFNWFLGILIVYWSEAANNKQSFTNQTSELTFLLIKHLRIIKFSLTFNFVLIKFLCYCLSSWERCFQTYEGINQLHIWGQK